MVVSKMMRFGVLMDCSLGLAGWAPRQVRLLGLWVGFLARGAQQQAAQRKKRQGEKSGGEIGLMHGKDYNGIIAIRANR
jgi:hypothetical protein